MKEYKMIHVEGRDIKISNPDKVLFPKAPLTKWDYVLACTQLAPYLISYTHNRALTTIRFPDGTKGKSFYQKNAPQHRPEWIQTKLEGSIEYLLLNDLPTLIWLANLACLEFHVSFNLISKIEYPTELVFDLDPSVEDFSRVVEVALITRQVLLQIGLDGIVKTSGASGLQIYVPIVPKYTYEQTRKVSHFIAKYLVEQHPSLITIERKVKYRGKQVYFDYLQHWYHKTLIAPYSPRAVAEAAVSTPLNWEELPSIHSPRVMNLFTIIPRLEKKGDLFQKFMKKEKYQLDNILHFIESHPH
ncbi:non-homologous end-joining DNA ligase [Hazenella coriacea]|uniref:Bifunctional non-homologous end joining protein LigD n=1 Tax=Hazenella coriacea TaxID=1179467 RepID=A0A4R3L2X6_9BACL|nr:non-homologous end-joining DNA ligase [Hazenella coriacea]TCS93943.1 bifunctional non-homologous end joining protein LigD [Hazenella coriacea]